MFMPLFQSPLQFMDSQIDRDCGFLKSIEVFDGSKSRQRSPRIPQDSHRLVLVNSYDVGETDVQEGRSS